MSARKFRNVLLQADERA